MLLQIHSGERWAFFAARGVDIDFVKDGWKDHTKVATGTDLLVLRQASGWQSSLPSDAVTKTVSHAY